MSTASKHNASQRVVVATPASSIPQSPSQYQSSSQRQLSSIHQPPTAYPPSNIHKSSGQTTNYFGPVRSSIVQSKHTFFCV